MRNKNLSLFCSALMAVFLITFIVILAVNAKSLSEISRLSSYYYNQATIEKMKAPHTVSIIFGVFGIVASLIGVGTFFSNLDKSKIALCITLLLLSIGEVVVLFVNNGGALSGADIAAVIFLFMMIMSSLISLVLSFNEIEYNRSAIALLVTSFLWIVVLLIYAIKSSGIVISISLILEFFLSIMIMVAMLIEAFGQSTRSHSEFQQPATSKTSTLVGTPNGNTFTAPLGPRPASTQSKEESSQQDSVTEKLALIKDLRDKWLITEEEYNQKREEIIKSI